MSRVDHYRRVMKARAEALEAAARQDTEELPVVAVDPATVQPVCEFCGSSGQAGCAVCRVLDGITEAELAAGV